MEDGEALQADHLVEFGEGFRRSLRRREIISRGESVGSVEADLQTLGILHRGEDLGDFLEACAEAGALPRGGLERDPHLKLRMLGMEPVEIPDNAGNARLHASPEMRPGVENKGADAELLAAEHLVGERAKGFLVVLGSLDAEIDKVARMGDDRAELAAQGVSGKGLGLRVGQRLGKPLHVVLHKDLHRRAADTRGPVDRGGHSADRRHMGP